MLGEWLTFCINDSFVVWEKIFSINFSKANSKFFLSLNYNRDNSYLFVNGKEIFKFEADNKNLNFPMQFFLGSISNSATEARQSSLNGNVYNFSFDCNSIDKWWHIELSQVFNDNK